MASNVDARSETPRGSSSAVPKSTPQSELDRIAAGSLRNVTGENFPVALRVLPKAVRDDLIRAYTYARFVDDIGDLAHGDRLELLDAIDDDVHRLFGGNPRLEPVRGLAPIVRDHGLTLEPLRDLIEANRRDQRVTSYETFDDLLEYCRLSAAPIGRIVLTIAGVTDELAIKRSDRVCAALQVLEHCQDVAEDAAAGRIYLPSADLRRAAVEPSQLTGPSTPNGLRKVVAQQVERSVELLADGRPLVRQLRGWARLAVLGYVAGGRATASALARADYDVLAKHIAPGKLRTAALAMSIMAGR